MAVSSLGDDPDGREPMARMVPAHEVGARSEFLLSLSTELARIGDPQDLMCTAMARLRGRLRATRATFAEIDDDAGGEVLLTQCEGDEARIEVATAPLDSFEPLIAAARAGATVVVRDSRTDPRSAPMYDTWYAPRGAGAMVAVPLMRSGRLAALLSISQAAPRDWSVWQVELVRRVAGVVWPAFEKARADRALAASEERLRLAHSMARLGAWEWDPATDQCFFSPESRDLFGLDGDEPRGLGDMLRNVEARDLPAVRAAVGSCMSGGVMEAEYRYRHPRRGTRWIHAKGGMAWRSGHACMIGIGMDVTERRQAEEALREVNRRKDEFLAMLAHELRNPLAPIRNAARILRMHSGTHTQLEWARAVIERQARHLTRLVDDLLDVSRIVRGRIVLERTTFDLRDCVRHALETSRPLIRERRHQLEVNLPQQPLLLEGDPARLAQVAGNLLINAAKYTDAGGRIRLDARREGESVLLRIRDTGVGIAPELLPRIFDLFTQGERTLDRPGGGLGIGLTLVRRVVEMHGGTVQAHSAGVGRGSEFVVRLPLQRAAGPGAGRHEPVPVRAAQLRILVVDDNVDAAESIAVLLSLEGHQVRSEHSAQAALDAAAVFAPDVVLLDIGLPGMDGYEVARRLRTGPAARPMRLVAVTGYGRRNDRERARAAGFDEHLVKPVEPDALNAVLH